MLVLGIDFTSSPTRRKPITCLPCILENGVLQSQALEKWPSFDEFEHRLKSPGPWIAGIDFPFGQSRKFIERIGWPQAWADYVRHAHSLGLANFRDELIGYCAGRPYGDKEHLRATDRVAKSKSPQKLYRPPAGLMFYQGAPRLIQAGVFIPRLQAGDPNKIVVEAYPGIIARKFGGRYKSDSKKKQTEDQYKSRSNMLSKIIAGACLPDYGVQVVAPASLAEDPTGNSLDALFCAIQAAWSWTQRENGFGVPFNFDPMEGWIADPTLSVLARV